MIPVLKVYLLGGFRLLYGEAPVTAINTPRLQSLVAYLALHRHAAQPRYHLAFLFWPDSTEAQARTNLRYLLHQLRRALPEADQFLHAGDGALHWRADAPFTLDVADFEQAVAQADQAGDPAEVRAALEKVVTLYQGDLLPSCYDDWLLPERERLSQRFSAALERLILLLETERDYRPAIRYAQRLLQHDPLHEATYQHLMRLHALSGDRASALRLYHTCATVLERELGVGPGPATQAAYEDLLHPKTPPTPPPAPLAPPSPHPRRHNLPIPLTSFIGRVREQAEVRRLLTTTRLLTLTGPGGCGKSRLALTVATERVTDYPDGVWLVELAALTDPLLLPQAVATPLGVREEPQRPLIATLAHALQSRALLLVLDNCEHLIEACAHLAHTLLSACPQLQILATSREPLSLAGETVWPVPPLSLPDPRHLPSVERLGQTEAIQLFVERAGAALPTFALTDENVAAVVQVCQRLDGMPLAIELAAARVKLLAVAQISERLDTALRLLTGGSRTALPRHQTLRAAIDWSHDLLSEPERALFRRLSVFVGGWTLEAAERVTSDESQVASDATPVTRHPLLATSEVLELLAHLVDKSLVVVDTPAGGAARYRLLETMRQYSHEKLAAAGEAETLQRQHARFFLALAEAAEPELRGAQQVAWLDRLDAEHDNLRAALAWSTAVGDRTELGLRLAGALWGLWWVRGYWSEGRRWLEALLARASARTGVRASALDRVGRLARKLGDYGAAWVCHAESLAIWQTLGDQHGIADALDNLGAVAWNEGDYTGARRLHEESLAIWRTLDDPRGLATTLNNLGLVAWNQGDYAAACALHEESLAIRRELGDQEGISNSLNNLGVVALDQGDYAAARALLEASLAIKRELGDKWGIAQAFMNLGVVALNQGDAAAARTLYQESLTIRRELGDQRGMAMCLNNLGEVAWFQGEYATAHALHAESLAIRREVGDKWGMAWSLNNLGLVALDQGDAAAARALHGESLAIQREVGEKNGIAACLAGLARVAVAQAQPERAALLLGATAALLEAIGGCLDVPERTAFDRSVATVRTTLGERQFAVAWAAGQALSLEQAIAEALRLVDELNSTEAQTGPNRPASVPSSPA